MDTSTRFHHVAIRARDFDATVGFYVEGIGLSVRHRWSLPRYRLTAAAYVFDAHGNGVEIFDPDADIAAQGRKRRPDDTEVVQNALLHLAFRVADVDAAYRRALDHGGTPRIEPEDLVLGEPPTPARTALVNSPNGEVVELLSSDVL